MSYWIPFRKKENKEKNPVAMLSLENMIRLHEIAGDLSRNLPRRAPVQKTIAFYCGSEHGENIRQMLPFTPENVIRMQMEKEPLYSPDPSIFTNNALYISYRPFSPVQAIQEIFLKDQYKAVFLSVSGKLHPPNQHVRVKASSQGNSFGPYILKGGPVNPRNSIVLNCKLS